MAELKARYSELEKRVEQLEQKELFGISRYLLLLDEHTTLKEQM